MVTVGELFHSLDRDEVIGAICRLYPEQPDAYPDGYLQAWRIVTAKEAAKPSGMMVELYRTETLDETPKSCVGVHGRDAAGECWAIEYRPWKEWLSMPVKILPEVGEITTIDALAHILWEMTWAGYDEEIIEQRLNEILDAADEIT